MRSRRIAGTAAVSLILLATMGWRADPAAARQGVPVSVEASRTSGPRASLRAVHELGQALDAVVWPAATRGPLLVVAPQHISAWRRNGDPAFAGADGAGGSRSPEPLPLPPPGGLRIESVAAHFGLRPVRCGGLTVLAPARMVVLANRLPDPDPFVGLSRNERMELFQGSLTAAQWRTLGSEQGIGVADLDVHQQRLFLALLPEPLRVLRHDPQGRTEPVPLTNVQRSAIRLRVNRTARFLLVGERRTAYTTVPPTEGAVQPSRLMVETDRRYVGFPGNGGTRERFGALLRDHVPNRLKPGQIDFDAAALDAAVGVSGAKTVGELVQAARVATRVEVYVDPRAGKLPIRVLGTEERTTARAGDVLRALCWGLTGTFRKVGPDERGRSAYLLTDDIEGMGTRHARIQQFLALGQARLEAIRREAYERMKERKAADAVEYAPDDPFAPTRAARRTIEAAWRTERGRSEGVDIEFAEMTPAQRDHVRRMLRAIQEGRQNGGSEYFADRARIETAMRATLLVPDVGEVEFPDAAGVSPVALLPPAGPGGQDDAGGGGAAGTPPPPISADPSVFPEALPDGVALCVAPATPEEACDAVTTAARRGVRRLWLLPADAEDPAARALIEAGIAAGKPLGVRVYVVARLMIASPSAPPGAEEIDRNLLGESGSVAAARRAAAPEPWPGAFAYREMAAVGDWLRPDVPATAARLTNRLDRLAGIPGLAGIILKDVRAPGYDYGEFMSPDFGPPGGDFGYVMPNRVALVREHGIDPVDLPTSFSGGMLGSAGGVDLSLPFFATADYGFSAQGLSSISDSGPPHQILLSWNALRAARQATFLRSLHDAVRSGHPELPMLAFTAGNALGYGWGVVGSWETEPPPVPSSATEATPVPGTPSPKVASAPPSPRTWLTLIPITAAALRAPAPRAENGGGATPPAETGSVRAFSRLLNSQLRARFPAPSGARGGDRPRPAPPYSGLVVDLSSLPLAAALRYVEEGIAAPAR